MNELIASMDTNYTFTYFNTAYKNEFKKIFGPELEIGDNILDKLKHLPEEQKNAKEIWGKAIGGEEFITINEFGDNKKQRNTYEIKYSSIMGTDRKITGAYHVVRDVTVQEMLKLKTKEVEHIKNKFLSNMSHELRTPLNAIMGYTQLIKYNTTDTNTKLYTNTILRSSKYLLNLINDTLDVNKIEQGAIILSKESVSVRCTISEIYEEILELAKSKSITINVDESDNNDVNIMVDKQRLRQILINIISNSIKYNKPNGTVDIYFEINDNMLFINIKDTGIGIKKENLEKLGKPFTRFEQDSTGIAGTGLGITITKLLCKLMNGVFKVESNIGIGSIFSVGFMISTDQAIESKKIIDTSVSKLDINKLFVYMDDNEFNLYLIEQIIKTYIPYSSYKLFSSSLVGFKYVTANVPDVLLLDINMPELDGLTLLRNLRGDKKFNKTKIIMISADITNNIEQKCYQYGANGYMSKPIILHKLIQIIDNLYKTNNIKN